MGRKKISVAIIDMNNGLPNLGIQGICDSLSVYGKAASLSFSTTIFRLRELGELPGMDHDIYISSGGPGSPYDGEGMTWEKDFFNFLEEIKRYNATGVATAPGINGDTDVAAVPKAPGSGSSFSKKYVLLICHSFQMACRKFGVGTLEQRNTPTFGIFPVFITEEGDSDPLFSGLPNPFFCVDSRSWQVTNPDDQLFSNEDALVLALERERPQPHLERCVMAIRFSKEICGTQFHPEASAEGMRTYLRQEETRKAIISAVGLQKYEDMLIHVDHPNRISLTQQLIIPNFLSEAIDHIKPGRI